MAPPPSRREGGRGGEIAAPPYPPASSSLFQQPVNTTLTVSRCQIDHRSSQLPTQAPDRPGEMPHQRSRQGDDLTAVVLRAGLAAASPHLTWAPRCFGR